MAITVNLITCIFSLQTGSPTRASRLHASGHQVRGQVQAQPPRARREAGGAAEDLMRGAAARARLRVSAPCPGECRLCVQGIKCNLQPTIFKTVFIVPVSRSRVIPMLRLDYSM